jgi:DNA-binding MurR/RpiR family transcriptional regulator
MRTKGLPFQEHSKRWVRPYQISLGEEIPSSETEKDVLQHLLFYLDKMQQSLYPCASAQRVRGASSMGNAKLGTDSRKVRQGEASDGTNASTRPWRTPLEERLRQAEPTLSTKRRKLLRTILSHAEDTYFLTSRKLAERYGVDAATVVRTIQALGYEKYSDFASDLRSHFILNITPYTVMKAAAREQRPIAAHVEHSLEMDMRNLSALRAQLDTRSVVALARKLDRARRTLVIGVDLAAALSYLLAYLLVTLGFNAEAPVGSTGNVQQKINLLGPKDLVIAISFGRCLRETVNAAIRARERGVPTFGITDSDRTPIARYCDSYWIAPIANPTFNGSYVAPVAAINALAVACAHIRPQRTLALLKQKQDELETSTRWFPLDGQLDDRAHSGGKS